MNPRLGHPASCRCIHSCMSQHASGTASGTACGSNSSCASCVLLLMTPSYSAPVLQSSTVCDRHNLTLAAGSDQMLGPRDVHTVGCLRVSGVLGTALHPLPP